MQQSGACCPQNIPFSIFTGDQKTMPLRIAYSTGLPVDLTSCTAIAVNLPNKDGTFTILSIANSAVSIVSPALLGQFEASISSVQSALLNVGEFQNVDVSFTIAGALFTVRFYQALSVFELD